MKKLKKGGRERHLMVMKLLSDSPMTVKQLTEKTSFSSSSIYRILENLRNTGIKVVKKDSEYRLVNIKPISYLINEKAVEKYEANQDLVRSYLLEKIKKGEIVLKKIAENSGVNYTKLYNWIAQRYDSNSFGEFEKLYKYIRENYLMKL